MREAFDRICDLYKLLQDDLSKKVFLGADAL